MGQIDWLVTIGLVGIFAIAIVTFSINFGIDNHAQENLMNDSEFNDLNQNITSSMNQLLVDSGTSSDAIQNMTVGSQSGESEGGTPFKTGVGTSLGMVYRTMQVAYARLFGGDQRFLIILNTFIALMGVASVLLIWRAWKGNP